MSANLQLPQKRLYKILNIISFIVLVSMFLYLILTWSTIPDTIPTHFDGTGDADSWNGKGTLIIMPAFAVLLYSMITLLEHHPDAWNTGIKLTPQNQDRVLAAVHGMIVITKLAMLLSFAWINYCSARCINLGKWFTPVSLTVIFGSIAYYLIKILHVPTGEKNKE